MTFPDHNDSLAAAPEPCPDRSELANLLNDDIRDRERLEQHVGECLRCQNILMELAGDIGRLPPPIPSGEEETPSPQFLDRLKIAARDAVQRQVDPAPPLSLPGIELHEEIGRGSTATVYRAHHAARNQVVAVKVVPINRVSAENLQRLRRGVEILARLDHPGVVRIYEVGRANEVVYGVLEYLPGGNLKAWVHDTSSPLGSSHAVSIAQAVAWVADISRAVHFMHEQGIVHRDLKPSNILMTGDGAPKVGDFGLAKYWLADSGITGVGETLGTPAYMAPEQASGQSVDSRSDIYSLGVILYELLASRPPFRGPTVFDTLDLIIREPPPPLSRFRNDIPDDIATLCRQCLDKDPKARPATAGRLAEELAHMSREIE